MRIIHTSDIHLGVKSRLNGKKLRTILLNSLENLCDFSIKKGVELLLISGDLFDSKKVSTKTIAIVQKSFQKLQVAGCNVIILPGTHDPYEDTSLYKNINLPDNVFLLTDEDNFYLDRENSIYITGKPYTKKHYGLNALEGLTPHPDAGLNIALVHASLMRGDIEMDSMVFSDEDLNESGFDYIALGHWHNYQVISDNPPAIYPGSLEPLEISHTNTGNIVFIETISQNNLTYEKINIGTLKVLNLDIIVDDKTKIDDIYQKILSVEDKNIILNLKISGRSPEDFEIDLQDIYDSFFESFHYLNVDISGLKQHIKLKSGGISERTVLGRFISKGTEKLNASENEEKREFWEEVIEEGIKRLYVPDNIVKSEESLFKETTDIDEE